MDNQFIKHFQTESLEGN